LLYNEHTHRKKKPGTTQEGKKKGNRGDLAPAAGGEGGRGGSKQSQNPVSMF